MLRAGVQKSDTETMHSVCSRRRGSLFVMTPGVVHMSEVHARLQHGTQISSRAISTISCRAGHNWTWPPFGPPFKLISARPVASESGNIRRHRLAWPLAETKLSVWIFESMSFCCSGQMPGHARQLTERTLFSSWASPNRWLERPASPLRYFLLVKYVLT